MPVSNREKNNIHTRERESNDCTSTGAPGVINIEQHERDRNGKTTNHKAVAVKLLIRLIYASNAKFGLKTMLHTSTSLFGYFRITV